MAHMWIADNSEAGPGKPEGWIVAPLTADAIALDAGVPSTVRDAEETPAALLSRIADSGGETWTLMGCEDVHVNGVPLFAGIVLLRDRDELQLRTSDGERARLFFSTEQLAVVEAFPGSQQETRCPRCKRMIDPGELAVRCPNDGVWHHQHDEKPCWTYGRHCTLCDQSTSLDGTYRWTPSEL